MLVLSRRKDERILIGGSIELCVVDIRGDKVRLGIQAPKDVLVLRSELAVQPRPPEQPFQKVA